MAIPCNECGANGAQCATKKCDNVICIACSQCTLSHHHISKTYKASRNDRRSKPWDPVDSDAEEEDGDNPEKSKRPYVHCRTCHPVKACRNDECPVEVFHPSETWDHCLSDWNRSGFFVEWKDAFLKSLTMTSPMMPDQRVEDGRRFKLFADLADNACGRDDGTLRWARKNYQIALEASPFVPETCPYCYMRALVPDMQFYNVAPYPRRLKRKRAGKKDLPSGVTINTKRVRLDDE